MELVLNNEHNGIELYFGEKPNKNIIDMLKANKFRWHSIKKCWYAKNTENNMKVAENISNGKIEIIENKKVEENELGIKVGDIFYMSWGYEQTNVDFFRVKALRGKTQVILQEVNLEMTQDKCVSGMSADRKYNSKNYSLVKNSCFVKDNENGIVKKVLGTKEEPYINMTSYANAYKYDGQELYESWYY